MTTLSVTRPEEILLLLVLLVVCLACGAPRWAIAAGALLGLVLIFLT